MKQYCIISHTHWDREWYMPLEQMRLRLVDLIDRCLTLLERESGYIFHLDAQTVVLEDYLSVRPEEKERLMRPIREGRLLVGPWYLQNDFFLTSGEATVRNLQEGLRLTKTFGCDAEPVGYAPDQFGQISQLPQILHGFGIDSFVFGRGVSDRHRDGSGKWVNSRHPAEFIWEGPDGSHVLAVFMPFWYNNLQRLPADPDKALFRLRELKEWFAPLTATPYLLMMNGVDHLEAQDDLPAIIDRVRPRLAADEQLVQTSLPAYIAAVRDDLAKNHTALSVHRGDMRCCDDGALLKGTLSSRIYLKQQNDALQDQLECRLEPLYALLELSGASGCQSRDHMRYMWKKLLRTHPHDSICGCSRDEVHDRMEQSYASLRRTVGEWTRRGMQTAADHLCRLDGASYHIVIANTLPFARREVVDCQIELPVDEAKSGVTLKNERGETIPCEVLSVCDDFHNEFTPLNLPLRFPVKRVMLRFTAELPAFGFADVSLLTEGMPLCPLPEREEPVTDRAVLENAWIRVTVYPNGRVALEDKVSGHCIEDALDIEDCADRGDSYLFRPGDEPALYWRDSPAEVTVTGQGTQIRRCTIRRTMTVPARYDFEKRCRTGAVLLTVSLTLSLSAVSPVLSVSYRFFNPACDHRLRLILRTGIETTKLLADAPFDVIVREDADQYPDTVNPVWPNTSFAALEAQNAGVALLTAGQREVEHLPEQRAMALTLLRATGVIGRDTETLIAQGTQWDCPGNQCLRELWGTVGVLFFSEGGRSDLPAAARRFRNPPPALFAPTDPHRFLCGCTAVQASATEEKFFYPDPYAGLRIPTQQPILSVSGEGVEVTALKPADGEKAIALRLVNLSDCETEATVKADCRIVSSDLREKRGELLGEGMAAFGLRPREIRTVLLMDPLP